MKHLPFWLVLVLIIGFWSAFMFFEAYVIYEMLK